MTISESLEQIDWMQTELDELTSLQEGFPVKTSALQEPGPACPVSAAACGPSSFEYSLKFDPVGLSLRTSLGLELSELTKCSLIWQEQATPLGRWWWVLSKPEHRTDGNGYGLWPTPNATDHLGGPRKPDGKRGRMLRDLAGPNPTLILPTPTAADESGRGYQYAGGDKSKPVLTLCGAVGAGKIPDGLSMMLPTPKARDERTGGDRKRKGGPSLSATVNGIGTGRLNPSFVEWMMGYPEGWTDVDDTDASE